MRILLVRHGESEGNVDENAYIEKGDNSVELTPTGWKQAIETGKFLRGFYSAPKTQKWPTIYISPYIRPKQTFSGIHAGIKDLFEGDPKLYEDPRLAEKFFGAASNLIHPDAKIGVEFAGALWHLSKKVHRKDPFSSKNLFGESTLETLVRVKGFQDGTFQRDVAQEKDDFIFIIHGAVIQAFLMTWAHVQMKHKGKIGKIGNCDIISIEGTPKNWKIRKIYDGETFTPVDIDILANAKPFTFKDLPLIPADIKRDFGLE